MANNKSRIFLFVNLGFMFVLVGMIISFFIFSLERTRMPGNFLAYGKDKNEDRVVTEDVAVAVSVQKAIRRVSEENMDAVVNISTETVVEMRNPFSDYFGDDFYRYFFGDGGRNRTQKQKSLGSGFIIDENGYLLSNLHVVKNASKIKVKLYNDPKEYDAKVVGTDEQSDLALLKIEGKKFPAVKLGDSDEVQPGDFAIAIGNPYGLNNTLTFGVVSAKGRGEIGDNRYQRYIQIDVPINPGNSGGPLFNIYGEVIGVNNMIYSTSGGNIGIGFAIPINLARKIVNDLKTTGRVSRGYLGVYPQDIDETLAEALKVKENSGVYVTEVVPDSPAAKAGIKDGDIITEIDKQKLTRAAELYQIIGEVNVGKTLAVKVIRDGKPLTLKVTIIERSDDAIDTPRATEATKGFIGLEVMELDDTLRQRYALNKAEKGALVVNVERGSVAQAGGFRAGDVIKKINDATINDLSEYQAFLKSDSAKAKRLTFLVKRQRFMLAITVDNPGK